MFIKLLYLEVTALEPIYYECKSYILAYKLYLLLRLEMESNQFKEICSFSH